MHADAMHQHAQHTGDVQFRGIHDDGIGSGAQRRHGPVAVQGVTLADLLGQRHQIGFHPAGGASTHAVALMRATVGDALGVKASGGIRDAETALAMIEAGASRLGVSATNAILAGLED